jgi:predicted ABC-type sugar transport system permease subunit
MKTHIILAAGILLTLGSAMSATTMSDMQATKSVAVDSTSVSREATRLAELLEVHTGSTAAVPLARPL